MPPTESNLPIQLLDKDPQWQGTDCQFVKKIMESTNSDNLVNSLLYARKFDLRELHEQLVEMMKLNTKKIINSAAFNALEYKDWAYVVSYFHPDAEAISEAVRKAKGVRSVDFLEPLNKYLEVGDNDEKRENEAKNGEEINPKRRLEFLN